MSKLELLKRMFSKGEKKGPGYGSIEQYYYDGPRPKDSGDAGQIGELFWNNRGPVVHKWHHYLPIYERYLSPLRSRPIRMLEIGVSKGGSLQLWRKYFGPEAVIFGIDIDPE